MLRLTVVCLAVGSLAQLAPPGCPLLVEPVSDDVGQLEPQVSAPEQADGGDDVELVASVAGADGDGTISYQWYQTYGRVVDLQNANTAAARFVAPLVPKDQTLRFRVDARNAAGATGSSEAAVTVAASPLADDSDSGDGDDSSVSDDGDTDAQDDDPLDDLLATGDTGTSVKDESTVYLVTSKGQIVIQLYTAEAPRTVMNFRTYVREDFYRGTIFHRVVQDESGEGEIVQGGGYLPGPEYKEPNHSPVPNESDNGLSNTRGSVAMARTSDPDSATSQFFFNLTDHSEEYDWQEGEPGYTVFGRVVQGMSVVDEIGRVEIDPPGDGAPVDDIVIIRVGFQ
jgi:cyclophilin family peptidyl-prolyl cis-trans isomerase